MKVRRLVALLTAGMMVTALTATTAMAESGAESVAEAAADGVISAGAGAGKGYKIAVIQQHQTNAFQMAVSEAAHFTLDGARTSASQKGVHVVRYSDGKVRKVIVR